MDNSGKFKLFAAWCLFLLAALNLLDLVCTSSLIARYGIWIESNPFVVFLWTGHPLGFILFKVFTSTLLVICGLYRRKLKKWCVAAALPAAGYSYVVGMSLYYLFSLPG